MRCRLEASVNSSQSDQDPLFVFERDQKKFALDVLIASKNEEREYGKILRKQPRSNFDLH